MAWYGATPKGQHVSRLEAIRNPTPRLAAKKIDSDRPEDNEAQAVEAPTEVEMPEINPSFGYLLELFSWAGQAASTGMGLVSLSWQELRAFRLENKLDLTLWERGVIKSMSEAYCIESSRATDPTRPAPYKVEKDEEDVVDVEKELAKAKIMREQLRAFRKK